MSENRTIVIESVGPNSKPLVVPVQPGMTTLTGYCGQGKSVCLEAIAVALGNEDKARVKPTAGKHVGKVDCLGVVLNVTPSRISRSGDSEVGSLEEFDVGSLIDPNVKNEASRNLHGIKSLLRMTKAHADPALFHHLAGDKAAFDALIGPEAQKSDDLVALAGKIKREFEKKANEIEKLAETEEAAALADRDALKGLDTKGETDQKKLQDAHTSAVQAYAKIREQWDAFHRAQKAADDARERIKTVHAEGKTVAECQVVADAKADEKLKAMEKVQKLEADLREAKAELETVNTAYSAAVDAVLAAKRSSNLTAEWQAAIDAAAGGTCPAAKDLEAAEIAVEEAQDAIEAGAVVRAAMVRAEKAAAHQKKADELRKLAHNLDLAAKGTDAVLSAAVASSRFSVQADMLMGKLPDGTEKPYYTFSAGEKTMIAVAEKIERVRKATLDPKQLCIVNLPQEQNQDIPDSVRDSLAQYATEHNTCIVTGLVGEDRELKCVVWEPKGEAAK